MFKIEKIIAKSLILTLFLFLNISLFNNVCVANDSSNTYYQKELYIPAGITCRALLTQNINAKSSVVGQKISLLLMEDFKYNDTLIAPEGSEIQGTITTVNAPGFANRHAKLSARFTIIRTPYNNFIPISAIFLTDDNDGILRGDTINETLKRYAKKTISGAASGAVSGVFSGLIWNRDKIGKHVAIGSAVGAGVGVISATIEKGENIIIPANSEIEIYFNQPITLNAI